MPADTVEITVEMLQRRLYVDQCVVASQVGSVPGVFILFQHEGGPGTSELPAEVCTVMTAERSREVALALLSAADKVDRLNATPEEDR